MWMWKSGKQNLIWIFFNLHATRSHLSWDFAYFLWIFSYIFYLGRLENSTLYSPWKLFYVVQVALSACTFSEKWGWFKWSFKDDELLPTHHQLVEKLMDCRKISSIRLPHDAFSFNWREFLLLTIDECKVKQKPLPDVTTGARYTGYWHSLTCSINVYWTFTRLSIIELKQKLALTYHTFQFRLFVNIISPGSFQEKGSECFSPHRFSMERLLATAELPAGT